MEHNHIPVAEISTTKYAKSPRLEKIWLIYVSQRKCIINWRLEKTESLAALSITYSDSSLQMKIKCSTVYGTF